MSKLLIVGTVAFDAIQTPFGKTDKILGGAATYIGLSASNFGIPAAIISVVGEDFPEEYLRMLEARDINTSGIEVVKGGKTFFWKGKYHQDLNTRDTLDTQLNVLADFKPVVPKPYANADFLVLGNLHPLVQQSVLEQMQQKPKLTILDTMDFWMDNNLQELEEVISKVDVITINDEEARQLSGEYTLAKAAKRIQKMGPKYVVIKKGEHGALLFYKEEMFFAPAIPLEQVCDPTGAGDCFAGGFAGYLTKTQDTSFENMRNAVIHGSNLASFCVEEFGTSRMQSITTNEILQRLQRFKALTQYELEMHLG